MTKVIIAALLTLFTVTAFAGDKNPQPEYMLLAGQLACQWFGQDTYQCLDLAYPAGAASHVVIIDYGTLVKLGAVKGTLKNKGGV